MSVKIDMAGISVMLAMPTHRELHPQTVISLLETQSALLARNVRFEIQLTYGSSLAHHARTKAAHTFLQSEMTRLFWIDSDIVWEAKDFIRLLALSSRMDCVCGVYPAKQDEPLFFLNVANGSAATDQFGCFPIEGAGLGFTIVRREVMERLAQNAPMLNFPDIPGGPVPHIFRCDDSDGNARGEDMAFFADVRALGYQVNLDPSITLGHAGSKIYRASILDQLKMAPVEVAA